MEQHEHKHEHHTEHHSSPDIQKELKTHLSGAAETFKDIKSGGKFDIAKEFMNAVEILKLNGKKMEEIGNAKAAALPALIFIAVGALAFHIGIYFYNIFYLATILDLLISFALLSAVIIALIFIIDFVANTFFKGHGKFGQLFRVLGYANLAMVVAVINQLGFIAAIWMVVVAYVALIKNKKLDVTNTILTLIIAIVVSALLCYLLQLLFVNILHTRGIIGMFYNPYYSMMNIRIY